MNNDKLSQLLEFLNSTPNDPFLIYAVALEYQKKADMENCLKYFEELTQNHPEYLGTYYQLGKLYEDLEQTTNALTTYRAGIEWAKKQGKQKTLSELQGALMNLEMEL